MFRLVLLFSFFSIFIFGQDNSIIFEHYNSIIVQSETKIYVSKINNICKLTKVSKLDSITKNLSLKEYKLLEKKIKKINTFSILDLPDNFLDGSYTKISCGWFSSYFEVNVYCLKENWKNKKLKPVIEFVELILKYAGLKKENLI